MNRLRWLRVYAGRQPPLGGSYPNRFSRIYTGADPSNKPSFRVMERLGLRFEGRRTQDGMEVIYYVLERAAPEESRR